MRLWQQLPLSGFKRVRIAAQRVDSGKMIKCATVEKLRGFLLGSFRRIVGVLAGSGAALSLLCVGKLGPKVGPE